MRLVDRSFRRCMLVLLAAWVLAVAPALAREAAPASAWMDELLSASTVTMLAWIWVLATLTPSMALSTSTPMRFSAYTPEPLAARPTVPPPPMATEPDTTSDWMVWSASASMRSAAGVVTAVLFR